MYDHYCYRLEAGVGMQNDAAVRAVVDERVVIDDRIRILSQGDVLTSRDEHRRRPRHFALARRGIVRRNTSDNFVRARTNCVLVVAGPLVVRGRNVEVATGAIAIRRYRWRNDDVLAQVHVRYQLLAYGFLTAHAARWLLNVKLVLFWIHGNTFGRRILR